MAAEKEKPNSKGSSDKRARPTDYEIGAGTFEAGLDDDGSGGQYERPAAKATVARSYGRRRRAAENSSSTTPKIIPASLQANGSTPRAQSVPIA